MSQPHILMCPPDHYAIEYEINPWMSRARQANNDRARQQWSDLVTILEEMGGAISRLIPVQGLPDLVFTANAALVFENQIFLSNFKYEQRQREQPVFANWFQQHGFDVHLLPEDSYHEGAGDALFCGDTLYAGYQIRSDVLAHQFVAQMIGCRVIPLELIDSYYYHLDTCFCPLRPDLAIFYPAAFDAYGIHALREHVAELIPVVDEEAKRFACNAVVVKDGIVTNTGCPQLHQALRSLGFHTWETPLDEFVKAGGSAKCLTLRLDGEDAAVW